MVMKLKIRRKVVKMGGSVGVTFPSIWVESAKIREGDEVEMDLEDSYMTIKKVR